MRGRPGVLRPVPGRGLDRAVRDGKLGLPRAHTGRQRGEERRCAAAVVAGRPISEANPPSGTSGTRAAQTMVFCQGDPLSSRRHSCQAANQAAGEEHWEPASLSGAQPG